MFLFCLNYWKDRVKEYILDKNAPSDGKTSGFDCMNNKFNTKQLAVQAKYDK